MKHLRYLSYLVRHKWFVLVAGLSLGVSPFRLLIHDWSKFLPSEWFPYAQNFYGDNAHEGLSAIGEFGLAELAPFGYFASERFSAAWNLHQKRNKHHWQYWLLTQDSGETFPLPMPKKYAREMLADWMGAGRTITGRWEVAEWYKKQRHRMFLHSETRQYVESFAALKAALEV